MKKAFRPSAYPLITVDPFFSIWSCADNLYDDCTRNWTELPSPILAGILVEENFYSMVATDVNFESNKNKMRQKDVKVSPLTTTYVFENEFARVTLKFTTPLLLEHIDIMSRPISYIEYEIEKKQSNDRIEFVFGLSSRCCVSNENQKVAFRKTNFSLCCGNTVQNPLAQSGDKVMIDWGYLHLCDKEAFVTKANEIKEIPMNAEYNPYKDMPYLAVRRKDEKGVITVAYDEVNPIEYFGEPLEEYCFNFFGSFSEMIKAAVSEYDKIKKMCDEFDERLIKEAEEFGENYSNIVTIAYRQAVSAHKLVADKEKNLLFLSKECGSNGCIGTLDVTYPSIPLFLKYNPELVNAMLRPIIKYACMPEWEFDFAPHDVGTYPIANGQVYGMDRQDKSIMQMPVEECGNMLLCLAAVYKYSNDKTLFDENKPLMKKWVQYLVEFGYDPGNQLCTDDFAGHLDHNCNLSIKAIAAIAAYAWLSNESKYRNIAEEYAKKWERDAANNEATALTFDRKDSWSLKYNMVWDSILGFNLFSEDVKEKEAKLYLSKLNRYGVPLDSRSDYTKLDWAMWSTCLCDNKEYFDKVCQSVIDMINETDDRVPLSDWYYTSNSRHIQFRNRTVVGGLYIKLLK